MSIEVCPSCGSQSIEWDGMHSKLRCLVRNCGHEWELENPIPYSQIKNVGLRLSVAPGQDIPARRMNERQG